MPAPSVSQPVVLVTGATGNLGAAVARRFAGQGASVVLFDRSADRLPHAFPEFAGSADHLLLGGVDLADEGSVSAAVARAVERFGRLDVFVHTVGAWRGGRSVHETPLADWAAMQEVNVLTAIRLVKAVVPQLLARRSGHIITVAARSGLEAGAGSAAYAAAKAAVLRLNEALSAELRDSGINVNTVLPSTLDTPQNRAAMPGADFARWVAPAAVADVIAFLASEGARGIHGAAVPVYGRG
jgi:NAD(P)-dependent dehydrogenase (short-subunit alcohol dehydrogenase family)